LAGCSGFRQGISGKEQFRNVSEIKKEERCLSPSDFGFHNTIEKKNGDLMFFDFEYAGWDDPAKTICDFFYQPRIPVPAEYEKWFVAPIEKLFDKSGDLALRVSMLKRILGLKWCCIFLNEFTPIDSLRRTFSLGKENVEQNLYNQLQKAENLLKTINHL